MINDGFMIAEVIFRHVFCRKTAKNGVMIMLLMRQYNLPFSNYLIAALIITWRSAYEQNTWFPMVQITGRVRIHWLLAVRGL